MGEITAIAGRYLELLRKTHGFAHALLDSLVRLSRSFFSSLRLFQRVKIFGGQGTAFLFALASDLSFAFLILQSF